MHLQLTYLQTRLKNKHRLSYVSRLFCVPSLTTVLQAVLQEERDKLLAEKASWATKVPPEDTIAVTEAATRIWETEKGELVKARDNALAETKVGDPFR